MDEKTPIPIWFFIGALLLIYGLMCLGSGIDQFAHPPATVLPGMHATFWGGLVLTALGGTYVVIFRPRR
jgi:hypothetical protein